MRLNFRKVSAITSSALMLGMSIATPVIASTYPSPFVDGSSSNVAIVYGTGEGVSSLDFVQAGNIQDDLDISETTIGVEGGESFSLEKTSDNFNLGDALNGMYLTLDADEFPDFLADGDYDDGDVDEEYEQEITLSSKTLDLFADIDYNDDEPALGFWWENGEEILNYTITFDDEVNFTEMADTNMPLFGGSYYVLDADEDQIDILDTSDTTSVATGETVSVGGRTVELTFINADSVQFSVDGETTDVLEENDEYELDDGSYIIPTEILYQGLEGGIERVDFAIGSGKIELINGQEAEQNDEDIDGLEVTIAIGSAVEFLDSLTLTWASDDDTFLTEEDSITMPEFEFISLAFGGLDFPSESETISIENGETLTISMGNYELPLMWYNDSAGSASQLFGEEDYELKIAEDTNFTYEEAGYGNESVLWFDSGKNVSDGKAADFGDYNLSATFSDKTVGNLSERDRFLVTLIETDGDLSDVETGYYEVNDIDIDDSDVWTIELNDLIGNNDLTFEDDSGEVGDTDEIGDITVTHVGFSSDNKSAILNFSTTTDGTIYFNKAVSEKGLVMTFPTDISDATNGDGYNITFQEEDKDDDLEDGEQFMAIIKNTTNDKYHVSRHNVTDYEVSDDNWLGYVVSDLASKISFDDGGDENDYSIEYYGEEVTADVQVVAGGEVTTESTGDILVIDSEVSSVSDKNLIVVGGSCINSAAASLVGGDYCGSNWESATDVGSGEFLIQSFGADEQTLTSKIALLVAGYDAADTVNAATYLTTQTVDTTAGKKYVGTTSTSATLVTEA